MGHTWDNLRSLASPRRVGYLICYVTNQCNLSCEFCFYHREIQKGRKAGLLSAAEFEAVARKLGPLMQLSLTGGEPFGRRDFAEITRVFCEHTKPRYVTVPTNAWFTEYMVEYLEELLPAYPHVYFRIVFSIDGIGADHDTARSAPGSYDRILASYAAVRAIRQKARNLVLDANTVLTARSSATIVHTLETLDRDFEFDNLSVTAARGDAKDPALLEWGRSDYQRVREFLSKRRRPAERRFLSAVWRGIDDLTYDRFERVVFDDVFVSRCVAGRKLAVLSEEGDVSPCEILGKTVGNVRDFDYDVHAVLNGEENRRLVDWIERTHCKCGFECALAANTVWSARSYPKLLFATLGNLMADVTSPPRE